MAPPRKHSAPESNRLPMVGFRVEPTVREAAERAAAADGRSLSSLIVKVLSGWLRKNGYLKRGRGKAR